MVRATVCAWLLALTAAAWSLAADPGLAEGKESRASAPTPQPLLVQKEALCLLGARYEGEGRPGEIPKLWGQEFDPRLPELEPRRAAPGFYGVVRALPGIVPGPFQYLAALPVASVKDPPKGLVGWEFPAHLYAVLPVRDLADLGAVQTSFRRDWLPRSDYVGDGDYTLEYYPPGFEGGLLYLYFPVAPKQPGQAKPQTVCHAEPKFVEKPELKLVGLEDLIVENQCVRSSKPVPSLYQAVAVRGGEIKHLVDASTLIGDTRADDPARVWQSGAVYRHLAGSEVTAFEDVPPDMSTRLLPASKYAVFSCEAPVDPVTKRPLAAADFGPLCPWYTTNRAHWGFKDKPYYLEVFYHADVPELGYPIARYELWIPLEKE
jgi:predicted transcriptional regulator YdeE